MWLGNILFTTLCDLMIPLQFLLEPCSFLLEFTSTLCAPANFVFQSCDAATVFLVNLQKRCFSHLPQLGRLRFERSVCFT